MNMLNNSQSSFIPKNNLPNRQKIGRRYNFFFISLVVYGLFIATPIASAVVFIYEKHTGNVINQTTRDLDSAIKSFNESELLTVSQFDSRLIASSEVLNSNVPLNALLQFFMQNSPKTVSFTGITVETAEDQMVAVTAEVESESFDYVLFYRDELLRNPNFTSSEITNVTYKGASEDSESTGKTSGDSSQAQSSKLSYKMTFTMPISFFVNQEITNTEEPLGSESVPEETLPETEVSPDVLPDNPNNQ